MFLEAILIKSGPSVISKTQNLEISLYNIVFADAKIPNKHKLTFYYQCFC